MGRGRSAFLLITVFLSGAAVMVVEMTAVRVLQPFFGSTTQVWANVIAVVLGALALGYYVGGRVADRRPSAAILYGVLACGGLAVVASAPLATPISKWLLPQEVDLENAMSLLLKGSLGATVLLFAPATLLLGTISPMAIRLLADAGAGKAAGRVFAMSTLGSIVGTYLPVLWFVPEHGSRKTLLIAAGMLLAPAVVGLLLSAGRRGGVAAAVAVILAATTAAVADTRPARGAPRLEFGGEAVVLAEAETEYQYVTVREDRYPTTTQRLLTINEGVYTYHSLEVVGRVLTQSRYYDDYSLLPLLLDLPEGEELRGAIVGLACGVTSRQWDHFWGDTYRLRVDGAEIDPVVMELGRRYFHLPPADSPWLRSHAMDGRQMLELAPRGATWHMIVVDAFANELYVPFHLGTVEFFDLCRRRLAPGGVLAMNVYAYHPDSPNLAALENTLATVFGRCLRVRQSWGGNFLLIARNGDEPADVKRLSPKRITARVGERGGVSEWKGVLGLGDWVQSHTTPIEPRDGAFVLTDDHSPLEWLTDRFIDRAEAALLGR